MKKIYTLICLVITLAVFGQAPTTCTLDPAFVSSNKSGIWPDSATNFLSGTVGVPYGQNITVKVPKDTVSTVTICFNRVELTTPAGFSNFNLPPGLTLLAGTTVTNSSGTFKFPGNANSCAVISGTPTTAGTYTLQFKVQPYLTPAISSCPASPNLTGGSALVGPTTLTYYIINIQPAPNGIKEEVNSKSFNLNNMPNPFTGKTSIKFNVKDEAQAKLVVYNLLGDKIFEDKFKTTYGDNTYELNAADWNSGVYFYTIQYKNHAETKRMVVNSQR